MKKIIDWDAKNPCKLVLGKWIKDSAKLKNILKINDLAAILFEIFSNNDLRCKSAGRKLRGMFRLTTDSWELTADKLWTGQATN